MRFEVKTDTFRNGDIVQTVAVVEETRAGEIRTRAGEIREIFTRNVLQTQEKQIRDALIALGWTPPPQ